ncbi:MAG: FtsX-like permease family protein, partial [Acidobacteriota bacterium]
MSYRTAGRIAWRETRSSMTKFFFVVLAVAAGVGALAGVQGFSASFRATLLDESRTVMAADLTARQFVPASDREIAALDALAKRGAEHTLITETISMATSAQAAPSSDAATPALVSIKAVDPSKYPYYGAVRLDPPMPLRDALQPATVAVAQDVLLRLNTKVGDSLRIGTGTYRISAVVLNEPDRMSGSLNVGLRMMMSRAAFASTGLMGFGSRGAYRYLFKMSPLSPPVAEVRSAVREALPEALIADFRESNPIITRGLDRATTFLSLVSLIAMIVGALGVAMAMHAHLQQKMDNIAVMKSLGATSRDIIGIYTLQTLMLGLVGGFAGVIVGRIVERTLPLLISRFFHMEIELGWNLAASAQGIAVGLLTTLLFTLPPLLAIRKVRPAMILRRDMPEAKMTWRNRFAEARLSLAVGGVILLGIGGVAAWLAESARVGGYFAGGLTVALILLAVVASALLRLIRFALKRTPWRIPTLARQGFANLYRQGNQAQAILVALGLGVMFTLTVYLVQHSLVGEIVQSAPPDAPNVFLIGITPEQVGPLKTLIAKQKGVVAQPEFVPSVAVRIEKVNGVPLEELRATGMSRRFRGTRSVMWAEEKPGSVTVMQGKWWSPNETQPVVSIDQEAALALGAKLGDDIVLSGAGHTFTARVVALHRVEQMRVGSANQFVFNPQALTGLPATFYGGVRMRPADVAAMERASYQAFPTVTVINVAEALAIVQQVVDQVALVIRFLSAFAILAGASSSQAAISTL